jgi:hypothetical protein
LSALSSSLCGRQQEASENDSTFWRYHMMHCWVGWYGSIGVLRRGGTPGRGGLPPPPTRTNRAHHPSSRQAATCTLAVAAGFRRRAGGRRGRRIARAGRPERRRHPAPRPRAYVTSLFNLCARGCVRQVASVEAAPLALPLRGGPAKISHARPATPLLLFCQQPSRN